MYNSLSLDKIVMKWFVYWQKEAERAAGGVTMYIKGLIEMDSWKVHRDDVLRLSVDKCSHVSFEMQSFSDRC